MSRPPDQPPDLSVAERAAAKQRAKELRRNPCDWSRIPIDVRGPYEALFADRRIDNKTIAELMTEDGIAVSYQAVQRHRLGACDYCKKMTAA